MGFDSCGKMVPFRIFDTFGRFETIGIVCDPPNYTFITAGTVAILYDDIPNFDLYNFPR